MKRRDILKGLGALGVGSLIPIKNLSSTDKLTGYLNSSELSYHNEAAGCWLTPQTTEGPYYINANLIRNDITEGRPGMPFNLTFNIINAVCQPIPNVLVDIWCCDIQGDYSAFNNFVGQTFMRGIQVTDQNGMANFYSVYPGWYPGRATHIHFKVRLNSQTYVTSQFCFPENINSEIYATPLYSGRGPNPTTNAADNIFHNAAPQYLIMSVQQNINGGYDGNYTIGINALTSIKEQNQNPGDYYLEQNYPNPFNPVTTLAYNIPQDSDVLLKIYDLLGSEIKTLVNSRQNADRYEIIFDGADLNSGFYFYKLTAGNFADTKEMLLIK